MAQKTRTRLNSLDQLANLRDSLPQDEQYIHPETFKKLHENLIESINSFNQQHGKVLRIERYKKTDQITRITFNSQYGYYPKIRVVKQQPQLLIKVSSKEEVPLDRFLKIILHKLSNNKKP